MISSRLCVVFFAVWFVANVAILATTIASRRGGHPPLNPRQLRDHHLHHVPATKLRRVSASPPTSTRAWELARHDTTIKTSHDHLATMFAQSTTSAESVLTPHKRVKHGRGKEMNINDGELAEAVNLSSVPIPTPAEGGDGEVRFLVIGDWGGPGRQPQRDVADAMRRVVRGGIVDRRPVHFVVSTGDNMYEDGVATVHDKKFKSHFEDVYGLDDELGKLRWYMTLGNHDHGAHGVFRDVYAQVNYSQRSRRWFLPSTFYHQRFVVGSSDNIGDGSASDARNRKQTSTPTLALDLVVLDTYDVSPYLTRMTKNQLAWANETLRSVQSSPTSACRVVVGHRPLYSSGTKHGSSPYMVKHVGELLDKYDVALYFCGDDHMMEVLDAGAVPPSEGGGDDKVAASAAVTSHDDNSGEESDRSSDIASRGASFTGPELSFHGKTGFIISGGGARAAKGALKRKVVRQSLFATEGYGFVDVRVRLRTGAISFDIVDRSGAVVAKGRHRCPAPITTREARQERP